VVIDLEATCSRDETVPKKEMEIIEIGAVAVDAELRCLDEFQALPEGNITAADGSMANGRAPSRFARARINPAALASMRQSGGSGPPSH